MYVGMYLCNACLKHHWGKPDGKQLEKQIDIVLLIKTRLCADILSKS